VPTLRIICKGEGEPIEGAVVWYKSGEGSVTDSSGSAFLNPKPTDFPLTIQCSCVGFQKATVVVNNPGDYEIELTLKRGFAHCIQEGTIERYGVGKIKKSALRLNYSYQFEGKNHQSAMILNRVY
jgi:hypothetical protein